MDAGFHFKPTSFAPDRCVCISCGIYFWILYILGLTLIEWDRDDDPLEEHKKRPNNCQLIANKTKHEEIKVRVHFNYYLRSRKKRSQQKRSSKKTQCISPNIL